MRETEASGPAGMQINFPFSARLGSPKTATFSNWLRNSVRIGMNLA